MSTFAPQLETFLRALAIDRGHLGLVVVNKDPKKLSLPGLTEGAVVVNLDAKSDVEAALAVLIDCAKQGEWMRLNLAGSTFPGRLYNQLRNISTMGHIQAGQVGPAGDVIELRWPKESKIIVVATQATIDKIQVPTFLHLFGPVVREE